MIPRVVNVRRIVNTIWPCVCLSICIFAVTKAYAAEISPIGVRIELSSQITKWWRNTETDAVITQLNEKLISRLNEKHPHWQFTQSNRTRSTAELVLRTVSRGVNEILLEIDLELYRPASSSQPRTRHMSMQLDQVRLYAPGQFVPSGWPNSSQAARDIWEKVDNLLQHHKEEHLGLLKKKVPVAINPSPINIADRSLVLPLPRDRYAHLAWSVFRLDCVIKTIPGSSVILLSEANNQWDVYDPSRPLALKVTVIDDPSKPNLDLQTLRVELAYLEEFKENLGWLFGDSN